MRLSTGKQYAGIWFDSEAEKQRYGQLLMMQQAGEISDLEYHSETVKLTQSVITYKPDFVYSEAGRKIYEDVKGSDLRLSPRWPTIKKLWRHYGPAESILREVRFKSSRGQYSFRTYKEILSQKEADHERE